MSETQLFATMTLPYLIRIVGTLLTLIVIAVFIRACILKDAIIAARYEKQVRVFETVGTVIAILLTIYTLDAFDTIHHGIQHGVFDPETSLEEIRMRVPMTPKESNLTPGTDLSDKMVIFFRFGCSDCEAVYQDLQLAMNDKPGVYWISTRSLQGQKLLEKYPIDETPSLVYIYPDGERFAIFQLHTKDSNGKVILNTRLMARAFELQQEQIAERQ